MIENKHCFLSMLSSVELNFENEHYLKKESGFYALKEPNITEVHFSIDIFELNGLRDKYILM